MQKSILKPVLTIIIIFIIVGVFVFLANTQSKLTKVNDSVITEEDSVDNVELEENVNAFMETQVGEDDLGKDDYYCSHIPYGHDDKYAYAWVYCMGFIVHEDGKLEQGTGFSDAVRLEYVKPNFQIVGYKMPNDGEAYGPSLKVLFPKEFYDKVITRPSNEEVKNLEQKVINKLQLSNPEYVTEGEIKDIVTSANIVRFTTKNNKNFIELDFVTKITAYEYAVRRITNDECTLPNMSKTEALKYAKEKLYEPYVNGDRKDIGLFTEHCIDGYISVEFGETVNLKPKIRSFPVSDTFIVKNSCRDEITLSSIKNQVENSGDFYAYREYETGGQYIPKVNIINGVVTSFDFLTGCAN